MTLPRVTASLALVALAACASNPAPIPLSADRADLGALVGEWSGEYSSAASGRSGSILFKLAAGADTAYGDVVMVPRAAASGSSGNAPSTSPAGTDVPRGGTPLFIRFARIEGEQVSGSLAPYMDPDCRCEVRTTFVGRLTSPDRLEGTFMTQSAMLSQPLSGRWSARRVAR